MRYLRSLQLNMERGCKANVEISPTCPRCGSCNTKFCYYNNYSLTQPRYFCKGCRRYWTKGGCLRNIPVGGGCQKTRRGKSTRLSTDIMSSRRGPMNYLLGLSHGSTSSSTMPLNVDLALVYANFLNPQPHSSNTGSGSEPQEPTRSASNNGLSMDPSISSGMTNGPDSSISLLEAGNGFPEWESLSDPFVDTHHLSKYENPNNPTVAFDHLMFENSVQADLRGKAIQQCGTEDTKYFVPPPLPSEDVLSEETPASWSSTHHMLVDDHSLQALELPVVRPDHQGQTEDPNLLTGANYREFDFPAGEKEVKRCGVPMRVYAHTNTYNYINTSSCI